MVALVATLGAAGVAGAQQQLMRAPEGKVSPLKKRIAVARFDDAATVEDSPFGVMDPDTQKKHQNDDLNSTLSKDLAFIRTGFTERMITALFATDRFIVVERRDIHKILREQDFAKTQRVSPSSGVALGEVVGAQYLVTGIVTLDRGEGRDWTSDAESTKTIAIPGSRSLWVGTGQAEPMDPGATDARAPGDATAPGARSPLDGPQLDCRPRGAQSRYAFHMRVYDVSTSQIVSALRVSGDSQWCLVKAAVQRMVVQMDKFPWRTRVAAVDGARVVVEGGRDVNMGFGYRLLQQVPASVSAGGSPSELEVIEVNDASSVTRPLAATPSVAVKPGDWVTFNGTAPGR